MFRALVVLYTYFAHFAELLAEWSGVPAPQPHLWSNHGPLGECHHRSRAGPLYESPTIRTILWWDTGSAAGRLVLNIMAAVSQWEREAIGERTRDALQHKRSQRERVGNVAF